MKITQIDVYQLNYGLHSKEYAMSGGRSVQTFLTNILRLSTDEGITGFGEVCPLGSNYMSAYAIGVPSGIAELAPTLLGADPTRIRTINDMMDQTMMGHNYIKSPIDEACWDILGKVTGQPVAALLGGRYVDDYPLYRAISQGTPEKMANDVAKYRSEGYHSFQLKVGSSVEGDIARIEAVLDLMEEGDTLVADANTGWLQHEAIRVVNAIDDGDFYLEAPCKTYEESLVVREHTTLPFVLCETITGMLPVIRAYNDRAMDVINIKISRVGGLTKAIEIRDMCERLGIIMTLEDSWGGDIATAAIAHLVGSTRPEFLFTSTDFNSYIDVQIADDAPKRQQGRLTVPTAPGLGITVDEARLGEPVFTAKM